MIFVYCPMGVQTGGPEALHQLVDSLSRQGQSAFLTPLPGTEHSQAVAEYQRYNATVRSAVDSESNCILVPEIAIDVLNNFKDARKMIWWLSAGQPGDDVIASNYEHVCQSEYARQTLRSVGIKGRMLSDYTVLDSFPAGPEERAPIVSYNANKGLEYVQAVMRLLPNVKWVAIRDMNRSQVSETLRKSAVYLDLGHHPGKDRIPREAALSGAVVVVGKRGSASYRKDVPILQKVDYDDPAGVASLISDCLNNMTETRQSQDSYRKSIRKEQAVFDSQVKSLFCL